MASRIMQATAVGFGLLAITAFKVPARANLVFNGGFEAGAVGFITGYGQSSYLVPSGEFAVGHDAGQFSPYFNGSPHGGYNFMVVNGAVSAGVTVWQQPGIAVAPHTTYELLAWVSSVYEINPAELSFSINGTNLGVISPSTTKGQWFLFDQTWNSGISATADILITDLNTAELGSDFGLDDISLDIAASVPAPAGIPVFAVGLGGLGLSRLRRRLSQPDISATE